MEHKTPQRPGKTQNLANTKPFLYNQWNMRCGSNIVGLESLKYFEDTQTC